MDHARVGDAICLPKIFQPHIVYGIQYHTLLCWGGRFCIDDTTYTTHILNASVGVNFSMRWRASRAARRIQRAWLRVQRRRALASCLLLRGWGEALEPLRQFT